MHKLRVHLSRAHVEGLSRLLETVVHSLERRSAVGTVTATDDADFAEILRHEQHGRLVEDCRVLRELVLTPGFAGDGVELSDSQADAVLRAASAVRLRIAEALLDSVGADDLEAGTVDFRRLSPTARQAYYAFVVLADVQGQLVASLDPEANEFND